MSQYTQGDRLRLTAEGRSTFPRLRSQYATYVGPAKIAGCIRVLVDGYKQATSYHTSFWEPADLTAEPTPPPSPEGRP